MEQKRIDVKKFVDKFMKLQTEAEKETMLSHIVNVKYIPYAEKVSFCRKAISASCIKHNEDGSTEIEIDSPARHVMYICGLLYEYTCLDIFSENGFSVYDMLEGNGLLSLIISYISESEVTNCQVVMNMCFDDFIDSNYNAQRFIVKMASKLADSVIPVIANNIGENFKDLPEETKEEISEGFKLIK